MFYSENSTSEPKQLKNALRGKTPTISTSPIYGCMRVNWHPCGLNFVIVLNTAHSEGHRMAKKTITKVSTFQNRPGKKAEMAG
jgi:hypothetical protein